MSTRHATRASVLASFVLSSRRFRGGLTALLLLASLASAPAMAGASADRMANLAPLHPDSSTRTIDPGHDAVLEAVKTVKGHGVAGQEVDWTVTGPGQADLAPVKSVTTSKSKTSQAGVASTVFHATVPGSYVVVASTPKNPACASSSCTGWVSTRFAVNVTAGGDDTGGGSPHSGLGRGALLDAAILVGAGLALGEAENRSKQDVPTLRFLRVSGGNNQSAAPNDPLPATLDVTATNSNGSSAAGVSIQWSANGGATLSASTSTTDGNGVAKVNVTSIGPGPGPVTITATRSDDSSATVSFTATVLPLSLVIVSGDGQNGLTNQNAPQPLVVEAEAGSQPQANVPILWEVVSGDATIVNIGNGSHTGGNGMNQATVHFGNNAGPIQVTATRTDNNASQTFNLTSSIVNTLSIVSGDGQAVCPNKPVANNLVVKALTNNRAAANVTIDWLASSGTNLGAPSTVTLVNGQTHVHINKVAPDYEAFPTTVNVTATRADDPTASVTFSESIAASTMKKFGSGDGQSGPIGTVATNQLDVEVDDGCGNPIKGQVVTWTIISGSGTVPASSTTGANGWAPVSFTYGTTPGTTQIQASAFGGALTQVFTVTATSSNFTITSGNNKTGAPGSKQNLTVTISPAISGVPVTFTVMPGANGDSGSSVAPASTTTTNGVATTQLTFGTVPEQFTVVATAGSSQATFIETVAGTFVNTTLTTVSGGNQIIAPGSPSPQDLIVQLNGSGSPLPNQTINWSATGGATVPATSTTGPTGQASIKVTPASSGSFTVTATFLAHAQYGPTQSVVFAENTTVPPVISSNSNDQSVGAALNTACVDLQKLTTRTPQQQDLLNQCLSLSQTSSGATAAAINQMTPAVAETQTSTATTATTTQFNNLAGRMTALRGGAHGMSFAGLAFDNDSGSLSLADVGSAVLGANDAAKKDSGDSFSRWGFFGSGQIDRLNASTQNATPGYSLDSNGVTFGVDYRVNDGLVLGGALGYTHQTTDLVGDQGDLTMHGVSLSGYATWYRKSDWYIDSSITWGDNSFDSHRHIDYALPQPDGSVVAIDQVAQASSGGNNLAGSVTFGRDFHAKATSYGFYGKLQYDHESFDGFTEQLEQNLPGNGLGLRVDSRTTTSVASVLGAKIDVNESMNWGVLIPHAEIEWQHEFRTDPNTFTAFFADDPTNTPILIHGDPTDADFFRFGAGMSFVFKQGRSAFLLYDRTIGRQGISEYNLSFGFRLEF
ncbi:MAG TPA: autotransporter domain-containing protein [Xanthomonadaceae bacterium]